MKKLLALIVVLLTCVASEALALPNTYPTLKVTNPAHRTADLKWTGLPSSPWAVIFTNGLDTVWPNTGFHRMYPVGPGTYYFKVCTPGPSVLICTRIVKAIIS
jgi:hypothetical protein